MGPLAEMGYAMESQTQPVIASALKVILYVFCVVFENVGSKSEHFSGRTSEFYKEHPLEQTGNVIMQAVLEKMIGENGYLDDFNLLCSLLQCTICDPYNKTHELSRISKWLDTLANGGWLPRTRERARQE